MALRGDSKGARGYKGQNKDGLEQNGDVQKLLRNWRKEYLVGATWSRFSKTSDNFCEHLDRIK